MRQRLRSLIAMAIVATSVVGLTAKGPTRKVTVTGSTLAAVLEFTDGAALANVWQGAFIGEPASHPDPTWARHAVALRS